MQSGCAKLFKRIDSKICVHAFCALLPVLLSPLAVSHHKEARCGYGMLLVAVYWLLEPVHLAATALLPVVLFPLLGVLSSAEVATNYMKESYMMVIGGLVLAIAVEESKLHERIALKILLLIGTEMKWLMLGLMLSTMFLSMWISNLGSTAMMVPIVDALIQKMSCKTKAMDKGRTSSIENNTFEHGQLSSVEVSKTEDGNRMKTVLLLSVCYGSSIGGTGTLTGTIPNLVLKSIMEELFPESTEITFASWMLYNVPGMILCVLIGWLFLWLIFVRCSSHRYDTGEGDSVKEIITEKYNSLGSLSFHEAEVLVLFAALTCLWVFRDPQFIPGWAYAISAETKIGDSAPAIAVAFLLFFLPSDIRNWKSGPILHWKTAQEKLPWGIILIVGGGSALASAAKKSKLSDLLGQQLTSLAVLPPALTLIVICLITTLLTEFMMNTTTTTILLPIFSQMAVSIGMNPLYLMLPVTVTSSYAFMLPIATGSNALVFESGNMRTADMAKPGFVMNIVCCAVQLFMLHTLGTTLFDLNTYPSWAGATPQILSAQGLFKVAKNMNLTINTL